jgi:thiamine-monophosphate kinase
LARLGVRAGLDCSDGLWRSTRLLAGASRVGAVIRADQLPLSPAIRRWGGRRALPWALAGGEEYELVFSAAPSLARRLSTLGFVTVVGDILPARKGVQILSQHQLQREAPSGFEHFDAK